MSAHGHSEDGYDFAHPMPIPVLLAVFVALTFLTVVTVAQANFDLGNIDVLVVMLIATIKAGLVAFFFMHLAYDKPFNILVFFGSFVFVGLFIIFTLSDSWMTSPDQIPVTDDAVPVATAEK
ncbi:MAG: cytochrome C oxidase subunit IV family protein [Pirellulales bacterium]|nr:cytochrome C oxidase subunit IV family protein [Pirellulales bacterium]